MQAFMRNMIPYTVKSGETLFMIANRFGVDIEQLRTVNPHINEYNIIAGQLIGIPSKQETLSLKPIPVNLIILDLNNTFRMLWEQHIVWTRIVISDITSDMAELNFAVARLLRNPGDFGEQMAKYYGYDFGRKFAALMHDHLSIAAELVQTAKRGDNQKFDELNRQWFKNADDMARVLASVNPYWDFKAWQKMFYEHLNLVLKEATQFLNNQLEANVLLFDQMERQALEMADTMTKGIINQFPYQFCK
ncbi:MAG: LysM peptidoglycan-binding domain-containing protein [Bacilli bacterium]|nr:LysM peptidoglycan-binding domain-containing protein [Bacilli bacterium]MDD4077936.1 LysM peptidoglycan-binding domain-containing protein [Bacilli bacterium]MDD4388401.1 LysM peptidoglycan-binding domain-containing protein [Bacilli bacterium]